MEKLTKAKVESLNPEETFEGMKALYRVLRPYLKKAAEASQNRFDDWVLAYLDRVFGFTG